MGVNFGPASNTCFLGPTRVHNQNGISISSAIFAQMTTQCPYTLQWATPSPSKLPLPILWGMWTPSNTWFLGPTRVLNPNGISIGSAIFAGLTTVTDWQTPTDHATQSVTIGCIYICSTVMWPTIYCKLGMSATKNFKYLPFITSKVTANF